MSGLLYGVGAFAAVLGAILIGFGIPINEFSFGNTLILAGTMAVVGGLIVIGLGVVVAQLQRLTEVLPARVPVRSSRPLEMFEPAAPSRAIAAQIPFPPKPKPDPGMHEPRPAELPMASADMSDGHIPPTLRNPYEPPATVEEDVSLSPKHPISAAAPAAADFDEEISESRQEARRDPMLDASWRPVPPTSTSAQTRPPHTAYFDAMWPPESKPAKNPLDADTTPYEPKFDPSSEPAAPPARRAEPETPKPRQGNEPRAVAILKSGVVDGMGYTLYVDGSIEAELPQGTLRFASINELRSHLENNA